MHSSANLLAGIQAKVRGEVPSHHQITSLGYVYRFREFLESQQHFDNESINLLAFRLSVLVKNGNVRFYQINKLDEDQSMTAEKNPEGWTAFLIPGDFNERVEENPAGETIRMIQTMSMAVDLATGNNDEEGMSARKMAYTSESLLTLGLDPIPQEFREAMDRYPLGIQSMEIRYQYDFALPDAMTVSQ